MFIDSHAHYDRKEFNKDRESLLEEIWKSGVEYIINAAIGFESNFKMLEKLGQYDRISFSVGIHPNKVGTDATVDARWERELQDLIAGKEHSFPAEYKGANHRIVAIGETGLDFNRLVRDETGELTTDSMIKLQRQYEWFHRQIRLSVSSGLPLILHIRDAYQEALEILEGYREVLGKEGAGVAHCFNGTVQDARRLIDYGFSLGIGGMVCNPANEALRETVAETDLEHIILETDAPFVTPAGVEERRNSSLNLPLIAAEISRLKGVDTEEVERITYDNTVKLFHLEQR
ncbi:MAG: TatD family hydrolase [Lachnospiraceae bacterium]|nr:TatD family hydrolase [Lachnospiraceae bacterium]